MLVKTWSPGAELNRCSTYGKNYETLDALPVVHLFPGGVGDCSPRVVKIQMFVNHFTLLA
jgi:hypothetical protein